MTNRFDNVAKALATGMPRRKVLKMLVGGAAVTATTVVADKDSTAQADWNVNYTLPKRRGPVFYIPVPSFPMPGVNQTEPEFNVPEPDGIVPPKLDLLPKLFPHINWNFVPLNPRRNQK